MESTETYVPAFTRFLHIIETHLQNRVCPQKKKKGCINVCVGCWKQSIFEQIRDKYLDSPIFVKDQDHDYETDDLLSDRDDLTVDQRIETWAAYYAQIDFGDDWDKYAMNPTVDKCDTQGRTSLHHAALDGDVDAVLDLLIEGANPHAVDNGGFTAFQLAAMEGHKEVINVFKQLDIHK